MRGSIQRVGLLVFLTAFTQQQNATSTEPPTTTTTPSLLPSTPILSSSTQPPTPTASPPLVCTISKSLCSYSLQIHPSTHIYIGVLILFLFVIGQTIHYFYLEELNAQMFEEIDETEADRSKQLAPEENEEEEKDRRERLAYGMHVGSYLVQTSKTPGGRVMTVLERRPRRFSFATAPPITPASRVSRPQTTMKEEQKEVYQLVVMVDKWGRGIELISLVNDVEVPTSKTTAEEKSRYAMELVLQHMEKMTEQKVFIHGVIDEKLSEEKHRLICGSENMEAEIFSEVRLELKLEMMAPEHLLMSVFTARVQPTIEQPNPIAMPTRGSEQTMLPNKDAPRNDKLPTPPRKTKAAKSDTSEEKKNMHSMKPKGRSIREVKKEKGKKSEVSKRSPPKTDTQPEKPAKEVKEKLANSKESLPSSAETLQKKKKKETTVSGRE